MFVDVGLVKLQVGYDPMSSQAVPSLPSLVLSLLLQGLMRSIVNPRKLEHRFRMIHDGIPFTLMA